MRRNYAASIRQMDDWLARVLALFDELGILGDTELVLTSDHGENFGEGRLIGHAFSLDDRLIRVPFVASGPVDLPLGRVVSIADVPRFLAHAGGVDDHPWGDPLSGEVAVAQFDAPAVAGDPNVAEALRVWGLGADAGRHLVTSFTCATDGDVKLVRRGEHEEVFDLAADPLELVPLPADGDQRLRPLRAALGRGDGGRARPDHRCARERRPPRRGRERPGGPDAPPRVPLTSADQPFDEGHLEDLVVGDGAVAEVALLAEQLAVVGRHDHPRVLRYEVEQLLEHAVDVAGGVHLATAELVHPVLVEEGRPRRP